MFNSQKFDNAVELGSRSALLVIYNNVIIKNDETHEDLESHKRVKKFKYSENYVSPKLNLSLFNS